MSQSESCHVPTKKKKRKNARARTVVEYHGSDPQGFALRCSLFLKILPDERCCLCFGADTRVFGCVCRLNCFIQFCGKERKEGDLESKANSAADKAANDEGGHNDSTRNGVAEGDDGQEHFDHRRQEQEHENLLAVFVIAKLFEGCLV